MKRLYILSCIFLFSFLFYGQEKWEEYIADLTVENENEEELMNLYESFSLLAQYPLNLNEATKDNLQELPFLSDIQIEKLYEYLIKYGPMQTIYELRMVPDLDLRTIELILPFIKVEKPDQPSPVFSFKDLAKGKHIYMIRVDKCLNTKEGYKSIQEEEFKKNPNKRYLGAPFYHSIRYEYKYQNKLQIGFNAEKDAGEIFWNKEKKGYDFYSAYFLLKESGHIKTFVLGNYRLNIGQGLIMNNDFSLGKNNRSLSSGKKRLSVKAHSSNREYNFLQGIATTIKLKNITGTFFYSNNKMDANIDEESNHILSIKKDGLHRTENELSKKHTARLKTYGTSFAFNKHKFTTGINLLHYEFDKPLVPEEKPYNFFYFRGTSNTNISLDYYGQFSQFTFFGETAISQNRAFATLNGIRIEASSFCHLNILYRYYAKNYQSFFANAFSESSSIQNENGIFMGMEINPFSFWNFNGYIDIFSFPWLQYGTDLPSSGFDSSLQVTYSPRRIISILLSYRYKNKESNMASSYLSEEDHTYPIENRISHRFRHQISYTGIPEIKTKTSLDYIFYQAAGAAYTDKGYLLSQEINWQQKKPDLELTAQIKYFNTDSYNSRLYGYERNVLYAFSIPSYYGKGFRTVLNVRYHMNAHLSGWLRLTRTRYTDREEIGSGLEKIEGNKKHDISFLIRWRF
ncbi:MAG: helix-hairpin-helix domain-containing protein [Candidatus Azobacteroides sp.]|nr:helix-hairpin-helix domain-containing protein [Candidatus Azobacteroides sp.]